MGWTAPTAAVAGGIYNAARYNSETKDNLNYIVLDSPRCSAIRNTNQSIANSTNVAITLPNTEEYDPLGMHPTGAGSEFITIPTGGDGLYVVRGMASWDNASTAGRRLISLDHNGASVDGAGQSGPADPVGNTTQGFGVEIRLVATDTVNMHCLQTSGGSLALVFARLQVRWVGL